MKKIRKKLEVAFQEDFGDTGGTRFFFSPSRINIIGEHIDYNGGNVLPCAIEIGTYALVRTNDTERLRLSSLNMNTGFDISLPLPAYEKNKDWANYGVGVMHYLEDKGYAIGGIDMVIYGNIPNGAGLSSSASLELLFGEVVNVLYNDGKIPKAELVQAGVWCENEFFGLHTGIMDQYVIGFGKKDHAMLLDTSIPSHEYVPFDLKDAVILIMNTQKRRELKDSKYNERRSECDEALSILKEKKPITHLCDLGEDDLDLVEAIEERTLRKRARHAVTENIRVQKAKKALLDNDLEELGKLLVQSNDSLRLDYEVTGEELDAITEAANSCDGCYGSRMTGAGFGGCAIALVQKSRLDDFQEFVAREYSEKTGKEAQFYISGAGDGVKEITE